MKYHLPPHVHVCVTADGAVFLDLHLDSYVGVDAEQSRELAFWVQGWPQPGGGDAASPAGHELAEILARRGLLVLRSSPGHAAANPRQLLADGELVPWDRMSSEGVNICSVFAVIRAYITAIWLLKFRSVEAAVRRHRKRASNARHDFDLRKAQALLSTFTHIRPWLYARRARCLVDSLTLLEFLSAYGVNPKWVFGVEVRPFRAHTWIQHDASVLNGTAEYVRAFKPLLVIPD